MNILLVDSDDRRRARLRRLLARGGHVVRAVSDPKAAFAHFRESPHGLVIADASSRKKAGTDLFRQVRSESCPWQSYLIQIGGARRTKGTRQLPSRLDQETDDVLSVPIRSAELTVRLQVAERTLGRRLEEASQMRRITRIPADSPHPIVELTTHGALVHANLASMPLLEAMGWVAGHPAPGPLKHLAESAAAAGRPKRAEFPCGERTYSFLAIGMDGGEVCLYGHDVTDIASPSPDPASPRGRGVGLTLRDPLTGLPTQLLLTDRVGQALAHARVAGTQVGLVKVNVDNCSDINGAYGHTVGDRLIVVVGECLRNEIRIGDTVLRDSGDGFVLLLQGVSGREAAGATCSRILRAIQQAGVDAELGFQVTLSMGLAMFPEDADTESTLVERAELALGEAKNAGRNCWRDYPAAVGANPMIGAERLLPRLMGALQLRQLHAQYQPIIAADTGAVAGFEALVRWHDPELGWIAPDRFIPIAETRGLIAEVGRQMADMVFRQLAIWRGSGFPVTVSLNISKRQLWDASFCDEMRQLAREHQLAPAWIILEATERQPLLNDRACRDTLERLTDAGFRLSLDDFGSGHSTFEVVSELPFHELKINMDLSRKAQTPRGRHVVRAILGMCQDLNLVSVAEGIEDPGLGRTLVEIGADNLQGYLYSPPLAADASLKYLQRHDEGRVMNAKAPEATATSRKLLRGDAPRRVSTRRP